MMGVGGLVRGPVAGVSASDGGSFGNDVISEPVVEAADAFADIDRGAPTGGSLKFGGVGNVVALIAGAPGAESDFGALAMEFGDDVEQFEEADGIAGAT